MYNLVYRFRYSLSTNRIGPGLRCLAKRRLFRFDVNRSSDWKSEQGRHNSAFRNSSARCAWTGLMGNLSVCADPTFRPVRCFGNHNRCKASACPRMHNKFLVFSDYREGKAYKGYEFSIQPMEVRTGSFNLSKDGIMSVESAVVISDQTITKAYYNDFCQIFALSELLDWDCQWYAPEFRVGTKPRSPRVRFASSAPVKPGVGERRGRIRSEDIVFSNRRPSPSTMRQGRLTATGDDYGGRE